MRARYQHGRIDRRKRKRGPDVWQFRWIEGGKLKSMLLGTVDQLPKLDDANRAAQQRWIINTDRPQNQLATVTVGCLIDRYMKDEAPRRCRPNAQKNYRCIFEKHIRPHWGEYDVRKVKAVAVESWLESRAHSRQVKSHIRVLMHTLFQAAMRWEMVDLNPLGLVRQARKRLKAPRALTPTEFRTLLEQLSQPFRTMVLTAGCLGLRVSGLLSLQWGDFDFDNLAVKIQRSVVEGRIYETKTEASEGVLPVAPELGAALMAYRKVSSFSAGSDGAAPAVQKELLRHANIQTTLNIYTQAISDQKREAVDKVARSLYLTCTFQKPLSANC